MVVTHNKECKMAFGRPSKHNLCPRCEELKAGSMPRKGWVQSKKDADQRRTLEIRNHNCKTSNCGPVCTAFEW